MVDEVFDEESSNASTSNSSGACSIQTYGTTGHRAQNAPNPSETVPKNAPPQHSLSRRISTVLAVRTYAPPAYAAHGEQELEDRSSGCLGRSPRGCSSTGRPLHRLPRDLRSPSSLGRLCLSLGACGRLSCCADSACTDSDLASTCAFSATCWARKRARERGAFGAREEECPSEERPELIGTA